MKVSYKNLSNYVDLSAFSVQKISEMFFNLGYEVEEIVDNSNNPFIVVGKIIEISKISWSNKLSYCKVEIDKNKCVQIICGANNVAINREVVVALPGAILANNFKIQERKMKDILSQGMICSLSELGIDEKFLSEDDLAGIHLFDLSLKLKVGSSALKALDLDDICFDITLTNNRHDNKCYYFLAKEISEYLDIKLKKIELDDSVLKVDNNKLFKVANDAKPCLNFTYLNIENFIVKPSPKWLKQYLFNANIRSINNLVDLTNFLLLELNQPTHAYDKKEMKDFPINITFCKQDYNVDVLSNETVNAKDLLVAADSNTRQIYGVAGVIGCKKSSINECSKHILLEIAQWNPVYVRATSRKINIMTQSSLIYSRFLPTQLTDLLIKRFLYLAKKEKWITNNPKVCYVKKSKTAKTEPFKVNFSLFKKVIGQEISIEQIYQLLKRKFLTKKLNNYFLITAPFYRLDITEPENFVEEFLKLYNYNSLKRLPFYSPLEKISLNYFIETKKLISDYLVDLGMFETRTYSLTKQNENKSNKQQYIVENALHSDNDAYRHLLLPSIIEVSAYNFNNGLEGGNLFEITQTNFYNNQLDKVEIENKLAMALTCDFFVSAKNKVVFNSKAVLSIVKTLFKQLNIDFTNIKIKANKSGEYETKKIFNPFNCYDLYFDANYLGTFGQIHPHFFQIQGYKLKNVYGLELNLTSLLTLKKVNKPLKMEFKYNLIKKEISFVAAESTYLHLDKIAFQNQLLASAQPYVEKLQVFDIFYNKVKKEYAIGFYVYFASDKPFESDEMQKVFFSAFAEVAKIHNLKINQ